ncbi:MAG TPA: alpha-N-acetylglucosaminidase C-terminal domain-containing protein, partial [Pseudonocardiaceae bacterium]|nr:alpha-N-acetylglucosaminidase C-terminal domain-containing protein [Pseudonocardiaceae bacterium]
DFGYSDLEARSWIPLPAHQPWWWFDNMSNFADPIPLDLMRRRVELGNRIAERMRELGVTPVVPGFLGFVPTDFGSRHPGVDVIAQGNWGAYVRPSLLNPVEPLFRQLADDFYRSQDQLFPGGQRAYGGDFFQEGGEVGDMDLAAAGASVQRAMQAANPGALWMLQAWSGNPRQQMMAGLDLSKVFVLDLQADVDPQWTNLDAFWGAPWTWGTISNAGGTVVLYGRLPAINTELPAVLTDPKRGALAGVHFAPEGNDTNPVLGDFLGDMFWRTQSVDLPAWISDYAARRYGRRDPEADAAWQLLLATAYGVSGNTGNVDTAPDSLFNAQPSLTATSADIYVTGVLPYDPGQLQLALRHLLAADPSLRREATYRYDLLDVARQVLDNAGRTLLPQLNEAFQAGDRTRFRSLADHWLDLITLQDNLLGTDARFLVGTWLAFARRSASTPGEAALLDYNARDILTAWGNRAVSDAGLHDYANRDWQGLVGDHYRHRWALLFDSLEAGTTVDWFAVNDAWNRRGNAYPTTPTGDTHQAADRVWQALAADAMFGRVTATVSGAAVDAVLANNNVTAAAGRASIALSAPDGFATSGPVSLGDVASGSSAHAAFTVQTLPGYVAKTAMDSIQLTATARFDYGASALTSAGYAELLIPAPVQPPYRTVTFTTSTFGQKDNSFAIYTGGADMWGGINEFGTIYRPAALAVGGSITTEVTAQADTGPWARAGIVVRDDLTTNGSTGYLTLAVTPGNGCLLSYDGNGDGKLDGLAIASGFGAPSQLRLTRTGPTTYTGACSPDGTTWTTVGTVTVPGGAPQDVGTAQDAGLFAEAASPTAMGLVRFSGFTVT